MSSNTSEANGGVNIKPSARKSIHSHCTTCNINCYTNMGKYGLKHRKAEEKSELSLREKGVDEVDNVMSKMVRQASPIPTNRNNNVKCRRNSFDLGVSTDNSDDSSGDENLLSKSSPATFLYSEDIYTSAIQSELQRSRNESIYSINNISPQRRHNISTGSHNNYPSLQHKQNKSINSEKSSHLLKALAILLIAVMAIIFKQYVSYEVKTYNVYDKLKYDNDLKDLKEKYKVKDNSILQVKAGVATIYKNQDTASFIFAYNSNSDNFNIMKFNNFVEDLASTTSRYLRNESKELYVTVDTSNLLIQTAKDFMNHYQADLYRTGVMLVKDINSIPSQLAMAFHYYCDEYNPLVKQSAIFSTLNLANCSKISDKKPTHEYIEKCLRNEWNAVDEDKIGPLLTRVVNIVVDVTMSF